MFGRPGQNFAVNHGPVGTLRYGLLNFNNWARILVIILAIVNLVFMCTLILPAVLAIYTLIIMFNKETAALFKEESAPAPAQQAG